ncbi:MAG: ATP-binding cassette domain-containing protein, partial [Alistipes sp.]|nr:ATP-binding cassette domain-containing protein [Alistipes sp.]
MDSVRVIDLRNVSIYHTDGKRRKHGAYSSDELVLSGVDLSVDAGEFVYLIGRVGSGKSTLLKTLYAEIDLCEGQGEVVGFDLRRIKRREIPHLRRSMGIVFQDYQLLTDRNVFRNLYDVMRATGWSDESAIRRRIDEVLH